MTTLRFLDLHKGNGYWNDVYRLANAAGLNASCPAGDPLRDVGRVGRQAAA